MIKINKIEFSQITMTDIVFDNVNDLVELINSLKIEKEVVEEVVQEMPELEEITDTEEVAVEEITELVVDISMTMEDITNKFNQSVLAPNSKNKYIGSIRRIISWFDFEVNELFMKKTELVIDTINEKYNNINTRKQYLSAVMNVYKYYNLQTLYQQVYDVFKEITDEPKPEVEAKPIEEAYDVMNELKSKYEELKTKLTNEYDENRMYCAIACLFLQTGVLRGSELINLYINKNDVCEDHQNYIDLENKKMVISNHKTAKKNGVRTIFLTNEFVELLKDFPDRMFVTNDKGEAYLDPTGLSKKMKKHFNFKNYELRKAKSSIALENIDTSVADAQGHGLSIQAKHYRKYK